MLADRPYNVKGEIGCYKETHCDREVAALNSPVCI